jgi:L-alanine-DL-glutamate epimerase-like enolase superfamily enzyme
MVDGNFSYTVKDAIRLARQLESYGVYFLEEPVWVDNPRGSAQVASATTLSVAGYETEFTRYGFRDLVDLRAVDIIQPSLIRSGGYSECRKIAAYASAHRMLCVAHSFSSGYALLANIHFIGGIENGDMVEYDQNFNSLRTEIIDQKLLTLNASGMIRVPETPGIGAVIRFDAIEQYRVG